MTHGVDTFIRRVEVKGSLAVLIAGALVFLLWNRMEPLSLILGGVLGMINLRLISKTVKGIVESDNPAKAKRALFVSHITKLGILGLLLVVVIKTRTFNPLTFLAGFVIVIVIILIEGIISAKKV
ncbi:MAG: ATP synthase subunit I [Nitrospirae bacterium]|nr:ATP synthase subunit I [Nitrospirota bacterium]